MPPNGIMLKNTSQITEADVIVCGGGTSGCVIASRLASSHPNLTILVIESGDDDRLDPRISRPLDGLFSVYETSSYINYVKSRPLAQLDGRQPVVPVGNVLGGSSSINFMMYNNPAGSDFDDWQASGWSFEEIKPFIKRSETYALPGAIDNVHGTNGPLGVSSGGYQSSYDDDFFTAFQKVTDIPRVDDLANYKVGHGVGRMAKLINVQTGQRTNTAHVYIHSNPKSNIQILTKTTIDRIILSDGDRRAVGVRVKDDQDSEREIKAKKMVIISAGAFGSPAILERSGIGKKEILEKAGVKCVVDLEGVGENYQDHELTICAYHCKDNAVTLDDYPRGIKAVKDAADGEWEQTGKGMAGTNGFDFGYKFRPTDEQIDQIGPEFKKHWKSVGGRDNPDKAMYSGPLVNYFMGPHTRPSEGKFFSMGAFLNYPAGRGSVHITSPDPISKLDFDAGLVVDPADMAVHIWIYKLQREVARRLPMYEKEHSISHPSFSPTSKAAVPSPSVEEMPHITYTKEDNEVIRQWVKKIVGTAYHSLGTCAMKTKSNGGVVDAKLSVHGVQGLKVADLSICPTNMGSNTTTVAVVIGERAAALFSEELVNDHIA